MVQIAEPGATLERWLGAGTPRQRALATMVIERQRGAGIQAIAWRLGVHKDTVRRWLARYRRDGIAALRDRRQQADRRRTFDEKTRAAIQQVAAHPPADFGVPRPRWSLSRLRDCLVRTQVVRRISIERLRQILCEMNGLPRSWRDPLPERICLVGDERRALQRMSGVATLGLRAATVLAAATDQPVKAIAFDLRTSESTVRRWLARYRDGGVRALEQSRPYRQPTVFTASVRQRIVAVAAQSPQALGVAGERWSLDQLRRYLVGRRVVTSVSREWLRHILREGHHSSAA